VSQAALLKIDTAVQALGFGASTRELTQQLRPKAHLRFVLPSGGGGFILNIKNAVKAAVERTSDVNVTLDFHEIEMSAEKILNELHMVHQDKVSALGIFTLDTVEIRDKIDATVTSGVPVVTMVSDVPAARRSMFVGIDNNAAGRTAGRLMGKFLRGETGRVAVITGSMNARDHLERYFAFRDVLARDFRNIAVLPVFETSSLDRYIMDCVKGALEAHDDLLGIYLVTGGVSGVLAALRERPDGPRPVFIAHDLTPNTRRGLISGEIDAVINQSAVKIADAAVSSLLAKFAPNTSGGEVSKGGIGIEVFVLDNLP